MNSYLQGLLTGTVLCSSLFLFIGSAPASYYSIDDVMGIVEDIESDVSHMKRWGVECDGGSVRCNGGNVDEVNYGVECN
jgi:hypothetical protein